MEYQLEYTLEARVDVLCWVFIPLLWRGGFLQSKKTG